MPTLGDIGSAIRSRFRRLGGTDPRALAMEREIEQMRSRVRAFIGSAPSAASARQLSDGQMAAHLRELNAARSDDPKAVARVDDFRNMATGIGVRGVDKRRALGQWGYAEQSEFESRFMWRGSDMADRAVSKLVDEIFREGFRVRVAGDKALSDDVERATQDLGLLEAVSDAMKFARAFGGCGMFLGADDGTRDLAQPLNEERIRSFDFVQPFSPLELVPVTWYADPLRPKFGRPQTYRLTPLDTPPGWSPTLYQMPVIHESRIIPFQGNVSWRGQIIYNVHPGWGDSVFVRVRQVLEDFEQAWGAVSILVSDFAVSTLKIKNLAELMSAGRAALENRAQVLEDARSVARVTIVDSEEDFKRETTAVTGLPELLDRVCNRLAAAVDLPVSLLMGQEPAGLNATGDSDIRWWYGTVASQQRAKAKPPLEKILRLRFKAQNGVTRGKIPERWGIHFPSLWRPSETEQADIRLKQAQTDQIYAQNSVLSPKEIATSRFGGEEYSTDTQLDADARDGLELPDPDPEPPDDEEPTPTIELPRGTKEPTDVPIPVGKNLGFGDAIHDQPRGLDGRVREGTAGPTRFAHHSAAELVEAHSQIAGQQDHPDRLELETEVARRGFGDIDGLKNALARSDGSPDQPRDSDGKFASGGGSSPTSRAQAATEAAKEASTQAAAKGTSAAHVEAAQAHLAAAKAHDAVEGRRHSERAVQKAAQKVRGGAAPGPDTLGAARGLMGPTASQGDVHRLAAQIHEREVVRQHLAKR